MLKREYEPSKLKHCSMFQVCPCVSVHLNSGLSIIHLFPITPNKFQPDLSWIDILVASQSFSSTAVGKINVSQFWDQGTLAMILFISRSTCAPQVTSQTRVFQYKWYEWGAFMWRKPKESFRQRGLSLNIPKIHSSSKVPQKSSSQAWMKATGEDKVSTSFAKWSRKQGWQIWIIQVAWKTIHLST